MAHLLLLAFLHSTAPTGWLPPSGFAGNAIHSQRGTQPRNLDGQHLSAATTTTLLHNYTTMLVYGGRTRHIAIKLTDPRWDEALVWSRGLHQEVGQWQWLWKWKWQGSWGQSQSCRKY